MGILTTIWNDSRKSKFETNLAMAVDSYICGRKPLLHSSVQATVLKVLNRESFYGVKGENTETVS